MVPVALAIIVLGRYDPLQWVMLTADKVPQTVTRVPMTLPDTHYQALANQHPAIGAAFATYYTQHAGTLWLGLPVTPELPTAAGLTQYFTGGILTKTNNVTVLEKDRVTAVPVVADLLTAAADIPLGEPAASLTYADLRQAMQQPTTDRSAYWWLHTSLDPAITGIYVAANGTDGSHYVPAFFAAYLLKIPHWQQSIGAPLTDALPTNAWVGNREHHIVIQAFTYAVLRVDLAGAGALHADVQPVGLDYLAVFHLPTLTTYLATAWTNAPTVTVQTGPDVAITTATLGPDFPVTLLADTVWRGGRVWYHIQWTTLAARREGWVAGDSLTFTAPTGTPAQSASLDALSSRFTVMLPPLGNRLAVAVYVPELQRTFTSNGTLPIVMASTFKILIMLTVLYQAEQARVMLAPDQRVLLQTMIEESDNDAATTLYSQIGFDTGILQFMQAAGETGLYINAASFGYSTGTPQMMVHILAALSQGKILTAPNRTLAVELMSHVTPEQRQGIGDTAPPGSVYSMKDGWLLDTDGWVTASVGTVTWQNHTYNVAVYLRKSASSDEGWRVVNAVCALVANSLFGV